MKDEALERMQRSLERLKSEGILRNLDFGIETESECLRRSTEEVALRAIALRMVSLKASGIPDSLWADIVEEFQIAPHFSPMERKFVETPSPSKSDSIQFSWRSECYWVMLWALGFVEHLGRPDEECEISLADSFLQDNCLDEFLAQAKLLPQSDLLDEADLICRYHWAVRDAAIHGHNVPAGLHPGVVQERHQALNWLIGYDKAEWDDVPTDT
jgi:Domain of unknown function (DUF4272)